MITEINSNSGIGIAAEMFVIMSSNLGAKYLHISQNHVVDNMHINT